MIQPTKVRRTHALKVIGFFALLLLLTTIFVYLASKHLSAEQKIAASVVAGVCFAAGQLAQNTIISGEAAA